MLTKKYIRKTLRAIGHKYSGSLSGLDNTLYLKVGLLELCGWIEETIDYIFLDYASKRLSLDGESFFKEHIKHNYSFTYDKHFKYLLSLLIGTVKFEKIEQRIPISILVNFRATLNTLKTKRDNCAHTQITGLSVQLDSPTVLLQSLEHVYDGFRWFRKYLR